MQVRYKVHNFSGGSSVHGENYLATILVVPCDYFSYRSCLTLKFFVVLVFFLERYINRALFLQCLSYLSRSPGLWPSFAFQHSRLLAKKITRIKTEPTKLNSVEDSIFA